MEPTSLGPAVTLIQSLEAAELCISNKLILPAVKLIYSTIDILAWLSVEEEEHSGHDFIKWAERYVIPHIGLGNCNGVDLWGARCGILHMATAESKPTRKKSPNAAIRVVYLWGTETRFPQPGLKGQNFKYVHVESLLKSVDYGHQQFFTELNEMDSPPTYLNGKFSKIMSFTTTRL